MKLTKQILFKRLRPYLQKMGYTEFKCDGGFFAKKVDDYFYLCICPTIHRYYDDQFTIDFYLSCVMSIYATYDDIPRNCEVRPGFLLSQEERLSRYGSDICDIWWQGLDDSSFLDFISILQLTEPRVLERRMKLKEELDKSQEVLRMSAIIHSIVELVNQDPCVLKGTYLYTPRCLNNTPIVWYNASESVLSDIGEASKYSVPSYANMAYCQFTLGNNAETVKA